MTLFLNYAPWILSAVLLVMLLYSRITNKRRVNTANSSIQDTEFDKLEKLLEQNKAFSASAPINATMFQTLDLDTLKQHIADSIPKFLGYQTAVLGIIDPERKVLKRVAVSDTEHAKKALRSLEVPFSNIEIKLSDKDNFCIQAIDSNKILNTNDLYNVLRPAISRENATIVQNAMGTKTTLVYPIYSTATKEPLGVFLVSVNKLAEEITEFEKQTLSHFVDGIHIALVNANLYTSLRIVTNELRIANEKLKELDDLKTDFISIASHQLRAPLTAMQGYSSMLLEGSYGAISEEVRRIIDKVFQSSQRLIIIVNDLLEISRIEKGKLELVFNSLNVSELLKDIIEELRPNAEKKNIAIKFNCPDTQEIVVEADLHKMRQVLTNIVDNAIKYTNAGFVHVCAEIRDHSALITVQDSGVGISPENMKYLFQKFSRVKGISKMYTDGSGLGLYVAQEIMRLHHGEIWVTSDGTGKGSQFFISLPLKTQDEKAK